jgi:hypothetical protein
LRIEKWKAPHAPVPSHTPVLALQVVELSGREVEATQVGPPLHVLGAQVDPVKSQIDSTQLSATTYISEASADSAGIASCLRAAPHRSEVIRRKTDAQSPTALTVQGSRNGSYTACACNRIASYCAPLPLQVVELSQQ